MIAVIDTSVVLKWYVREDDSPLARSLLSLDLAAPDVVLVELANALWKKAQKGELAGGQVHASLLHLPDAVKLVPSAALVDGALHLALALPHPVYDCLFVALSQELGVPLITSDKRLCLRAGAAGLGDQVVSLAEWIPNA